MMTKRRSGRLANLKLLIVLPVAAVIMLIFSACNNSPKSAAANPEAEKTVIYNKVDELPVYNGGDSALLSFLGKNIIYPESAKTNKIQGKVVVKFCITDMGKVDQVSIQTGVDPALDNEAIRVVKSLPDWTPGKKDGKNVNVWYAIPITFKLQ